METERRSIMNIIWPYMDKPYMASATFRKDQTDREDDRNPGDAFPIMIRFLSRRSGGFCRAVQTWMWRCSAIIGASPERSASGRLASQRPSFVFSRASEQRQAVCMNDHLHRRAMTDRLSFANNSLE